MKPELECKGISWYGCLTKTFNPAPVKEQNVAQHIAYSELVMTPFHPGPKGGQVRRDDLAFKVTRFPEAYMDDVGAWKSMRSERYTRKLSGPWLDIRMCFCPAYAKRVSSKWDGFGDTPPTRYVPITMLNTFDIDKKPMKKELDMDPNSIPWKTEMDKGNCGRTIDGKQAVWTLGGATNLVLTLENHFLEVGSFKKYCKYADYRVAIETLRAEVEKVTQYEADLAAKEKPAPITTNWIGHYVEGALVPMQSSLQVDPLVAAGIRK